ncbi:response regulator transcription factor [Chelatococcus asaccharovorans]|uniref:response regulator transcription factor n=1 Tax=Chelatococcus asaccharovorans TaxID=28210 RepID=UPI00224C69D7|nr:response regulator transcription factor [Chelatococcus asaccharovorans]CAH1668054.1 DNA-binding NarL/FixJ family response regulator [Chelatococcus asaccharovorans]CAH1680427.1 DNA-binding NarL/FixJ family response regulator [Chelatococcus asaccharovorans]
MTSEILSPVVHEAGPLAGGFSPTGLDKVNTMDAILPASLSMRPSTTTIIIIEPRTLIRDCLLQSLKALTNGDTVLAFATVEDWRVADPHPAPNTIILLCPAGRKAKDIDGKGGVFPEDCKHMPVVLLSDIEEAEQILDALDQGARGYIPTSMSLDVAVEALHLVQAGGIFVPASSLISSRRSIEEHAQTTKNNGNSLFTVRQAAVVGALRQGKANKRIAYELNMQESTVKVHVRNIMRKLKAKNRTEVAVLTHELFLKRGDS